MFRKMTALFAGVCLFVTGIVWAGGGRQPGTTTATGDSPDIEVWWVNTGNKPIEKGSPVYNFYKDQLGVGVIFPYIEWNGGVDYLNALNMRIAAGTMPHMFLPYNGIETELARNGAIVDLTDLLPKYAPKLWNVIPQSTWNVVRANDPTGKNRIYWIPQNLAYEREGGQIRQDWLDKLGLKMPKTQAEYLAVLRAFRDKDPNGNGLADELPTGGRQGARWMDHLFNMYGIAMFEGYPDWDIYNGELTYSAVTRNARDALIFLNQLYTEKLMDPETFLNDKSRWEGKIHSGKAGNYFHWTLTTYEFLSNIYRGSGVKADIRIMPVIQAPGYEGKGFVTHKSIGNPAWVVSSRQDETHLMMCLKFLNEVADQSKWPDLYFGVEGMHHEVVNGKKAKLPNDPSKQQQTYTPADHWGTLDYAISDLERSISEDNRWMYEQSIRNIRELQQYVRNIAGDGLPETVYDDYPEIKRCTLWQEYATKIIIGTFPISKFDEFVDRWNREGGAEVTRRAREWYAKIAQ